MQTKWIIDSETSQNIDPFFKQMMINIFNAINNTEEAIQKRLGARSDSAKADIRTMIKSLKLMGYIEENNGQYRVLKEL